LIAMENPEEVLRWVSRLSKSTFDEKI